MKSKICKVCDGELVHCEPQEKAFSLQLKCMNCGTVSTTGHQSSVELASERRSVFILPSECKQTKSIPQQIDTSPDVDSDNSVSQSNNEPYPKLGRTVDVGHINSANPEAAALPPRFDSDTRRPGEVNPDTVLANALLTDIPFRNQKMRESRRLPHYLIRNSGAQMEAIIQTLVVRTNRFTRERSVIGWAQGLANIPRVNRPLRILDELCKGHSACTDISFRVQDRDLYVRFNALASTRILYLKWLLAACLWVAFGPLLLSLYLKSSGALNSWINDYAQKTSEFEHEGQDKKVFYVNRIKKGVVSVDGNKLIESLRTGKIVKLGPDITEIFTSEGFRFAHAVTDNSSATSPLETSLYSRLSMSDGTIAAEILAAIISYSIEVYLGPQETAVIVDRNSKYKLKTNTIFGSSTTLHNRIKRVDFLERSKLTDAIDIWFKPIAAVEIKEALAGATTEEKPWSIWKLFLADPKGGIFHIGPAFLIITGLSGAVFWFLPKHYLNGFCRVLGWPTQDEFENYVLAMPARIEGFLSDLLLYDFGVQQKDIVNINSGAQS